jgi:hypothetical protein
VLAWLLRTCASKHRCAAVARTPANTGSDWRKSIREQTLSRLISSDITREEPRLLILLALADSDLHGLGIARGVQRLSKGRTRLWPASRARRRNRLDGLSRQDYEVASQTARGRRVVNGYRSLLHLVLRHLRDKHAADMEALFRQRLAEARERGRVAAFLPRLHAARDVATAFPH